MTLFVAERHDDQNRRLFRLFNVDYLATKYAWINFPLMVSVGIAVAFLTGPEGQPVVQVLTGVVYGLLIILSSFIHGLGHILSSKLVHAPVDAVIITATVSITQYCDDGPQPSRIEVGRSLGGPLANLLFGAVSILLYLAVAQNHYLLFFGAVNLLMGIMTLLPIPTLDGAVIWRNLYN